MRKIMFLSAALILTACDDTPKVDNRDASKIVAEVNRGPSFQIEPRPILEAEVKQLGFRSAGCVFSPGAGGNGAMVLAMKEAGYMKFGGEIVRFAADSGSRELREGVRTRYFGNTHLFLLSLTDQQGGAHLIVEDHNDQVVFDSYGKIWCDELPPVVTPESGSS